MAGEKAESIVDRALVSKHGVDPSELSTLTPEEKDRIRRFVRTPSSEGERVVGMDLATAAKLPDAVELLRGVLEDEDEESSIRAAAANSLGVLGGADAEQALRVAVSSDNPIVLQATIAKSLGRIAGIGSEQSIRALSQDDSNSVKEQALFAFTLLSFAADLDGGIPDIPADDELTPASDSEYEDLRVTPLGRSEALEILRWIGDSPYGLDLDPESAVHVDCRPDPHFLLLDRRASVEALDGAKQTVGLVAAHDPVGDGYAIAYVILAWSAANGVAISLHRPDGKMALFGRGDMDGATIKFRMHSTSRTSLRPMTIQGTFERGSVDPSVRTSPARSDRPLLDRPI